MPSVPMAVANRRPSAQVSEGEPWMAVTVGRPSGDQPVSQASLASDRDRTHSDPSVTTAATNRRPSAQVSDADPSAPAPGLPSAVHDAFARVRTHTVPSVATAPAYRLSSAQVNDGVPCKVTVGRPNDVHVALVRVRTDRLPSVAMAPTSRSLSAETVGSPGTRRAGADDAGAHVLPLLLTVRLNAGTADQVEAPQVVG